MKINITYGDVMRHCTNEELATIILYKGVGMIIEVLQAMEEHEKTAQFWELVNEYRDGLIQEQKAWLDQVVKLPPEEE